MTDLTLDTRIQRNPEQVFTDMDGETVMLNIEQGSYFGIGGTGNRIWELLDEPKTIKELVNCIYSEFDVSEATCEADVLSFCDSLVDANLAQLACCESA